MICHPAADAARAAMAARRFDEAVRIVEHALQVEPTHADLIAERAWLHLMVGNEDTAYALLNPAYGGLRYMQLESALHAHYYCRTLLDANDEKAQERLRRFKGTLAKNVGVRVSACLIVRDEENNLPRCLASLRGIVDEVVVVDTGSRDKTLSIARNAGAVVGHFEWCDDFAAARNRALDLATGDWALWIDADEELAPESAAAFRRAVVRPHIGGYDIEIVNLVDDRPDGGKLLHYPVRLFRRLPEVRFSGAIHEQIQPAITALGLPWAHLEGARLIHHGYRPSVLADGQKLERTRTMLEKAVVRNPRDGFQWFNLANAHFTQGDAVQAERAAREALRHLAPGAAYRDLTYQILAASLNRQGMPEAAIVVCETCDREGDGGILNDFEWAQAYLAASRPEQALEIADRCVLCEWPRGMTGDYGIATTKRYIIRGQILAVLGRNDEALEMFDVAITADPGFGAARMSRGMLHERDGDYELAIRDYTVATSDPGCEHDARKALGRAQLNFGDPAAVENLALAWRSAPDDHETWTMWARACETFGDSPQLLTAFEEMASRAEPSVDDLVDWGRALAGSGEYDRALACFTEAIQRAPQLANAYFNAGDLLYRLEAYADAAHVYEAGLRHDPRNPEAWFTLGNALAQLNLEDGAKIAYDQALSLAPDHERARHNRSLMAA